MLEGNIRALQTESNRLDHEKKVHDHRLKENLEKVKLNKQLPYLISNVVEVRRHHAPFAGHAPSCASVHTSKRNLS